MQVLYIIKALMQFYVIGVVCHFKCFNTQMLAMLSFLSGGECWPCDVTLVPTVAAVLSWCQHFSCLLQLQGAVPVEHVRYLHIL